MNKKNKGIGYLDTFYNEDKEAETTCGHCINFMREHPHHEREKRGEVSKYGWCRFYIGCIHDKHTVSAKTCKYFSLF